MRGLRKAADGGESVFAQPGTYFYVTCVLVDCVESEAGTVVAGAERGAYQEAIGFSTGAARANVQNLRVWGAGGSRLPTARSAR